MNMAAIVLAGGESRRMGQDKAQLIWRDGRTLLEHQIFKLESWLGPSAVFVSGDRGGSRAIVDQRIKLGPLGGIQASLVKICESNQYTQALFLPVDMPSVAIGDLERMRNAIGSAEACIFENHNLPILFQNLRRVVAEIEELIADQLESFAIKGLLHRLKVEAIAETPTWDRENLNTPEGFRHAISQAN